MFKLGSDPELVILDEKNNLKSAIPLIDGAKDSPIKLKNGTVIHDNVNIEFGITPADTADEWVSRTKSVLKQISKMLPQDYKMEAVASSEFPDSELACEEARVFGCDPDFDAYDVSVNIVPPGAAGGNLRSCGGHVHIGHPKIANNFDEVLAVAKAMDIFLGIPSLFLDTDPTSARRRKLYGKAGCHRPKPYGIEYRSLGNFWVKNPEMTRLIYFLVEDGLNAHFNGLIAHINQNEIRSVINNSDVDMAKAIYANLVAPLLSERTKLQISKVVEQPALSLYDSWGI